MSERPILFSAPMVRALLDGRKTQTRRVVKPQPARVISRGTALPRIGEVYAYNSPSDGWMLVRAAPQPRENAHVARCPYGRPGDQLWVRENFRMEPAADSLKPSIYCAGLSFPVGIHYEADGPAPTGWRKLRPAIHLPRGACRLTLRVTDVRVERLNEISEEDAVAEGAPPGGFDEDGRFYENPVGPDRGNHQCGFAGLWERINGPSSWDANPWVWVVSFERATP